MDKHQDHILKWAGVGPFTVKGKRSEVVYDTWGGGGVTPRQKRVKVKLAKGWNDLTLKVIDTEGGWGFCCRVRKPDGTALEGLKIEAR